MPAVRRSPRKANGLANKTLSVPQTRPSIRTKPQGLHPELLNPTGDLTLRLGVDYGSGNSSCAFVVVNKNDTGYFDVINRVRALYTHDESTRFPTIVALRPFEENPKRALLVFADEAMSSLHRGDLKFNMMFFYQKLGLIKDFDGIFESDQLSIQDLRDRHSKALKLAAKFDKIMVQYPEHRESEEVSLNKIEDVIVQSLKYFLALVKKNIRQKLQLKPEQVDKVFELNTEVGFAAPAFWKDSMLDSFAHLIEQAGWPKKVKIWSEPKCALAACAASGWVELLEQQRSERKGTLLNTAMVTIDIGAGSLDVTTAQATEINDSTIKFATICESGGSLCGGYLLNTKIEGRLKSMFGRSLPNIKESVTEHDNPKITTEDFMQGFQYDLARQNFEVVEKEEGDNEFELEKKRKRAIVYGGVHLPAAEYTYMTRSAVKMPVEKLIAAHDEYLERIFYHIDEQLARTRAAAKEETKIQLVLVGGVTRAPYIVKKIEEHLEDCADVDVIAIEEAHKPLVAIGCVLFMGQNTFGGRYRSREAYAIPIAMPYDKKKHGSNRILDERTDMGEEARDLAKLILPLGALAAGEYMLQLEWTFAFKNDDGTRRTSDPRNDPDFSMTMEQQVLTTSDPIYGNTDHIPYEQVNSFDKRRVLNVEFSKERCDIIERNKRYRKIGFWRDSQTEQWFFVCDVRIIIDFPDMRIRWRAEIPKSGKFESSDEEVWESEAFFTSINNHGVNDGDEGYVAMDTSD